MPVGLSTRDALAPPPHAIRTPLPRTIIRHSAGGQREPSSARTHPHMMKSHREGAGEVLQPIDMCTSHGMPICHRQISKLTPRARWMYSDHDRRRHHDRPGVGHDDLVVDDSLEIFFHPPRGRSREGFFCVVRRPYAPCRLRCAHLPSQPLPFLPLTGRFWSLARLLPAGWAASSCAGRPQVSSGWRPTRRSRRARSRGAPGGEKGASSMLAARGVRLSAGRRRAAICVGADHPLSVWCVGRSGTMTARVARRSAAAGQAGSGVEALAAAASRPSGDASSRSRGGAWRRCAGGGGERGGRARTGGVRPVCAHPAHLAPRV